MSGDLQVTFDPEKKQFLAYQVHQIVDQINNPDKEILNDNQLLHDEKNFRQGEHLFQPLDLKKIINYEEILAHFRLSLQNSRNEWLSRENPRLGQSQRFLVQETAVAGKYPVILARRSEDFLRKLLEIEIPGIAQKKIMIQDILRSPGVISKVLINSKFPMNNLLGACLGEKGIRAQIIEKEMNPERIHL
ncbi:17049_t:CDS:2, partial [Funneliformis geosporum]